MWSSESSDGPSRKGLVNVRRTFTILASVLMPAALLAPMATQAVADPTPHQTSAPGEQRMYSPQHTGATKRKARHHKRGHGGHRGHTPRAYTPPALNWGSCADARLNARGVQCAMMLVPLDYARPRGTMIKIAVSRKLHTDPDFKGMIAVNPGGPGGSGLIYPVLQSAIPNGVGAKYDWYGFDPRGVGSSEPALSCDPDYPGMGYDRPNYVPTKRWIESWWLSAAKKYTKDCARSDARELLGHLHTTEVAQDLNSLRRVVGERKLNYYGFSYGTYLGQIYATMYPRQVGRMVWDGVVDAKRAFYLSNLDQDVWFDKNIDTYFKWLADHDSAFGLGTDWRRVRAGYYDQIAALDKNPAAGGKLGPDELADVLQSAAYYVYDWDSIGAAYATLIKTGDGSDLLGMYAGPGDDNGFAVYNGVQCTDASWPGWRRTERDSWRIYRQHPFLTWGNTWFNAPCLTWPARSRQAVKVKGQAVRSRILLISETNDAATPYSGALATRKAFRTSYLIEGVGGTTHAGSLSGIACTDDTIASYLDTGRLPARRPGNRSDQQCDPVPAPEPSTAAAQRRSVAPSTADRMPAFVRRGLEQAQLTGR